MRGNGKSERIVSSLQPLYGSSTALGPSISTNLLPGDYLEPLYKRDRSGGAGVQNRAGGRILPDCVDQGGASAGIRVPSFRIKEPGGLSTGFVCDLSTKGSK